MDRGLNGLLGLSGGVPDDYPQYSDDPMLQAGLNGDDNAMYGALGMDAPQDPYAMVGMPEPTEVRQGDAMAYDMLGGQSPQLTDANVQALAQSLGLTPQNVGPLEAMPEDPMYARNFDVLRNFLTRGHL